MPALDQPFDGVTMSHTIIINKKSGRFTATSAYSDKDGKLIPGLSGSSDTGQCKEIK
jgi:hypothetical protein